MDLADPEFLETPGQQLGVAFNPASAEKLFEGSSHTFAEIAALGKDRKPLPHFPLAASLKADAAEVRSAPIPARDTLFHNDSLSAAARA